MQNLSESLQTFVQAQELLRLAFLDSQGYPRIAPLWFVVMDGHYFASTGTSSAKWKAIQRDSRIGWVIDGGERSHYKGVSMRGHAKEVTDFAQRSQIYHLLGMKYFGSDTDPKFIEIFGAVDDPETVYFQLEPNGGMAWEY